MRPNFSQVTIAVLQRANFDQGSSLREKDVYKCPNFNFNFFKRKKVEFFKCLLIELTFMYKTSIENDYL